QRRADVFFARARAAGLSHAPFRVIGVALFAPLHGEAVALAALHHERDRLGRLAERDRQATRRERIQRAGVTGAARGGGGAGRGTAETAWVDVMPTGLSSTIQP